MNIELLAPGGSLESVIAAYNAGADAVYTGGLLFGARASADNLTEEQLIDVLNYAHLHGKKLYLTVNTLLKDKEIEQNLYDFLKPLYEAGLDAVIVQDMGVLTFIRANFPDIHIHASTQMTIYGIETVKKLSDLGATRIVTPRELSLNEIKDIHENSSIEIESFVHGALCYCYSGQCFLSSYIGGRSGNRGRCAQPCRMEYDVINNGKLLNQGNNKYVLSPKDICTLNILPQIIEAGVHSLKIEGRMKKIEYITGVVSIYRKYLDLYLDNPSNYKVDYKDIQLLMDLFNRNGFSESYYEKHNSKDMISLKKPEFRKGNNEYVQYLKQKFAGKKLKRELNVKALFKENEPFTISTQIGDKIITAAGKEPQLANNKPIDKASLEKQLRKTGNTDFEVGEMTIEMDDNLFISIGEINQLRRDFLEKVKDELLREFKRVALCKQNTPKKYNTTPTIAASASVWTMEQLDVVLKYDYIKTVYLTSQVLSASQLKEALTLSKAAGKEVYLSLPYVFRKKDKEYFLKNYLQTAKQFDGFLVRNIEEYYYLKNLGVVNNYIFDYNVYTSNRLSKEFLLDGGNNKTTIPLELNSKELQHRGCGGEEMIIYGYMPAMISANCCLNTCNNCTHNNDTYIIRDRLKNDFKVKCVCKYCYNVMYNCKPLSLFKFYDIIKGLNPDSVRLSFTFENRHVTENILNKAERTINLSIPAEEDDKSTRGHFNRGVL